MALRDRFPKRDTDPLLRTGNYIDRRSGMVDSAKQRRQERALARSPLPVQGEPEPEPEPVVSFTVRTDTASVIVGAQGTATVNCLGGEVAVSGGGSSSGTGSTTTMIGSQPVGTSPPTGWSASFYNNSGSTDTITVYAVCRSES